MSEGAPVLELRGITKRFPGVVALRDVSFDLHAGEVHVLFGENGAGKSTLINVIAGTYPPDEGSMTFEGDAITQVSPSFTVHDVLDRFTVIVQDVAPAGIDSFFVTLPAIDQSSVLLPHCFFSS